MIDSAMFLISSPYVSGLFIYILVMAYYRVYSSLLRGKTQETHMFTCRVGYTTSFDILVKGL